jgi:hypothetical protein
MNAWSTRGFPVLLQAAVGLRVNSEQAAFAALPFYVVRKPLAIIVRLDLTAGLCQKGLFQREARQTVRVVLRFLFSAACSPCLTS